MTTVLDRRLWIVSGKGGVGKSTLTAALGVWAARHRRRVLICEFDAQNRIPHLLGQPEPNVSTIDIKPEDAMREYGRMVLKLEPLYRAVFENRIARHFLEFIPSLRELVSLGKALFHLQEREADGRFRFDHVVLDAPATGHAVSLFRLPQVLLDTVPAGPLAHEARKMRDALVNPTTTAAFCVTTPEEMPINETFEWVKAFRDQVRIQPTGIFLNQFVSPRFDAADESDLSGHPSLLELARTHQALADASANARQQLRALELPILTLPFLPTAGWGRAELEHLVLSLQPLEAASG